MEGSVNKIKIIAIIHLNYLVMLTLYVFSSKSLKILEKCKALQLPRFNQLMLQRDESFS